MSDFLDRLAARAIGGETALVPRLPSLFEPLQRAPILPLSDDGETSPRHREAVSSATAPAVAPMDSPHASVTVTAASRVAPAAVAPAVAPTPALAAASAPRTAVQPAPIAAPTPSSVVERKAASPVPPHSTEALVPQPVQPRQTRVAVEQPETGVPSQLPNGALLPASTPVFGAARATDASARSIHVATRRALAAPTGTGGTSSEPVVHVSIGRLEVRAAQVSTTPPRRRDGPQPSSLDDYLRQRGGKATP